MVSLPVIQNGTPLQGDGVASSVSEALSLQSPIDLRTLAPVTVTPIKEVPTLVRRAHAAQVGWSAISVDERSHLIQKGAKRLLEQRAEILALVREEVGKLEVDGLFSEGIGAVESARGWSKLVERELRRERIRLNPIGFPKKRAYVDLIPRGVVGIIAPWNYPTAGLYRSVFPALLSGNAVVLKPSEYSPRSTAWFAEQLARELPPDVIQVVQGRGNVGAALIDAEIDACVFTGSVATGNKVREQCAARGLPVSVEMGGKDVAIVLRDCDLDRTIAGITHWTLANAGQACGAVEVVCVESAIADEFVTRISSAFARLRATAAPYSDVSPLSTRAQLELVKSHVADAREKGATVRAGGAPTGEGLFFSPTVIDHCTREMAVVRDETFGPVLAIMRVAGAAEAVGVVNGSRYGLTASIWSGDSTRAERLASRLNVGVVTINNHSLTGAMPELPWSGTRDTGFGVANSRHALATFVRPRALLIDDATDPEPYWLPYDEALWDLGDMLADAQLLKIRNAWKIPLVLRRRVQRVREFFAR